MNRVATSTVQYTMLRSSQNVQSKLADSLEQMDTQKKVNSYTDLGLDSTRTLSARAMLSNQQAQTGVLSSVGTTLDLYNDSLTSIDNNITKLRTSLLDATGSDTSAGLQQLIENSFQDFATSLNMQYAGQSIFGGSQTGTAPLQATSLSDLLGLDPSKVFANDQVKGSAQVADGQTMQYGIVASDVGQNVVQAFRTLAAAGPFGDTLTSDQRDALNTAMDQLGAGLQDVHGYNANNGRNQQQIDTLTDRASSRTIMLTKTIGDVEDADLGQVAQDITNNQTLLSASYAVFSRISSLSLADYL